MGSDQSTVNLSQQHMHQISVSATDLQTVQNSKNKPSALYAKMADHAPTLLPAVIQVKDKQSKNVKFEKRMESSDDLSKFIFQLVAAPSIFYQGGWQNGKQHGRGQVLTKSGIYFLGEFHYGVAQSNQALAVFPDGSYYLGAFDDNQFNGRGRFVSAFNHTTYEGNWQKNRPQGEGKESYNDGSFYEGDWWNGKKEGHGTFHWASGKVYKGEFKNGEMEGEGELSVPKTKGHFKGKFSKGLKTEGELTTPYGKYVGKFQNGLMHDPKGRFTWNDYRYYEGPFEFGQIHGRGRVVSTNVTVNGLWERGENVLIEKVE